MDTKLPWIQIWSSIQNINGAQDGSNGVDVQTVALHEMGHTLGLADYTVTLQFKSDTRQVMHYYTGVKRTLGNGDATGIWKLYQ